MNKPPLLRNNNPGYVSVGRGSISGHVSQRHAMASTGGVHPLKFPPTSTVLWDHRHTGPASTIHLSHYRNPVIVVEEKILRLLHRFAQDCSGETYKCLLIGSLSIDPDGCGVSVNVDRMETGHGSTEDVLCLSQLVPADVTIPCLVKKNSAKPSNSTEHYENSISLLCERCTAKSRIDVGHFLAVQANCSYHCNKQTFIFHIDFDMVLAMPSFKASPVSSIPLVPTALSKNLSGPMSMSDVQGESKSGYLTMDHTRKLLLVLESDPKINSLPLVGIWASGVANVHDPFIWASCIRFLFNKALHERVCMPPEPFLIVLYSPLRSKPEFYECVPFGGEAKLDFSLSTCHEVIQLPTDILSRSASPMEMELLAVEHGDKKDLFDIALHNSKQKRISAVPVKPQSLESHLSGSMEDITPRCKPAPHQTKAPAIRPSVPEVSLLFDDSAMSRSDGGHCRSSSTLEGATSPAYHNNSGSSSQRHMSPSSGAQHVISEQSKTIPPHDQYRNHPTYPQNGYTQPTMYQQPGGPYPARGFPGMQPQSLGPVNQNPSFIPMSYDPSVQGQYFMAPGSIHPGADSATQPGQYSGTYNVNYPVFNGGLPPEMPHPRPVVPKGRPTAPQGYSPVNRPLGNQGNVVYRPASPQQIYPGSAQEPLYSGQQWNQVMQPIYPSQGPVNAICNQKPPHPRHQHAPSTNATNFPGNPNTRISAQQQQQQRVVNKIPSPRHQVQAPISSKALPQPHTGHDSNESSPTHNSGSTDSGLHSNDSADSGGHLIDQSTTSAYGPVPPEVYERLKEQDEQLKTLREQLAMLLSKQNDSGHEVLEYSKSEDTQPSVRNPKSNTSAREQCSVAINTSLMWPNMERTVDEMHQTPHVFDASDLLDSSVRPNVHNSSHNDVIFAGRRSDPNSRHNQAEPTVTMTSSQPQSTNTSPQRPLAPGHHPQFPSPIQQSSIEVGNETLSLGDFQLGQLQDGTQDSIMSDMIVDLPDYTSMSPEKLGGSSSGYADTDSNRSPILGESVSMYEQQGMNGYMGRDRPAYGEGNDAMVPDQKHFFQNLIGNVKKLLAKPANGDDDQDNTNSTYHDHSLPNWPRGEEIPQYINEQQSFQNETTQMEKSINVEAMTRKALQAMGINLDNFQSNDSTKTSRSDPSFFLNSILLPKVDYTSMMLDSGESDLSHDADALAMKYLSDEQLSALAQQRVIKHQKNKHEPSMYSISAKNMSFASRKYLERYGLTGNKESQDNALKQEPEPLLRDHPVLEYLRKLQDCSHNKSHSGDDGKGLQTTSELSQTLYNQRTSNCGNNSQRCHSDGESFLSDHHSSAHSYPSASSDITSNRLMDQSRRHKVNRQVSSGTPVRNQTRPHPGHTPMNARHTGGGGDGGTPTRTIKSPSHDHSQQHKTSPPPTDRVLDIERLKKLPKLL